MSTSEFASTCLTLVVVLAVAGCEPTPAALDSAVHSDSDGNIAMDAGNSDAAASAADGGAATPMPDAIAPRMDATPDSTAPLNDAGVDAGAFDAAPADSTPQAGAAGLAGSGAAAGAGAGATAVAGTGAAGRGGGAAGGGDGNAAQAGAASIPQAAYSFIELDSDSLGEYIGAGKQYTYTRADSVLTLVAEAERLTVSVDGEQRWRGRFALPAGPGELRTGSYANLNTYSAQDLSLGGLDWSGEARTCGQASGWIAIDAVTYEAGQLTRLDLRFEQRCQPSTAALHGRIHWLSDDPTVPPGPIAPPPNDLWRAAQGATPASGNYVYLLSDPGAIGNGLGYVYTQADAILTLTEAHGHLSVRVAGNEDWSGEFATMVGVDSLQPGYYGHLRSGPANPARGTLSWSGEGSGCATRNSWFVVDYANYDGGVLKALDLRFEHYCESSNPAALHGQIHWRADDPTAPPLPVKPVPTALWRAAMSSLPATGSYVYLESQAGDSVGAGKNYLYTQANAILVVGASNTQIAVQITGDEQWLGRFQTMKSGTALELAYYGGAQQAPLNNPTRPGLDWLLIGHGCYALDGWLAIDTITYEADKLTAIDFRFEQRCTSSTGGLHGQVHWFANDPTRPAGPIDPPPSDLWKPAGGVLPASGNYVYLESEAGDFIGGGKVFTYPDTTPLTVMPYTDSVSVSVAGWTGRFNGMAGIGQLMAGYYGNLGNGHTSITNPTRGALSWDGQSRACNTAHGWFVVDHVEYVGTSVTALDLRFEQHCEDKAAALHGAVHYTHM